MNNDQRDERCQSTSMAQTLEPVIYKKRFFIIAIMSLLGLISTLMQPNYPSITNKLTKFYRVSEYWINFISTSGSIVGLFSTMPMNWIAEKYGIKLSVVISALCLSLASILVYMSINQSLYWLAVVSSSLGAIGGSKFRNSSL